MKPYAVIVEYVPLLRDVGLPILNRHNEVLCLIAEAEKLDEKAHRDAVQSTASRL